MQCIECAALNHKYTVLVTYKNPSHISATTSSLPPTPCGPECWPAPFSTLATIVIAVGLAMCIVITTFGNLLVLVSFVVERQIRQPTNFFIASLAVTDVLIGKMTTRWRYLFGLIWGLNELTHSVRKLESESN